MAPVIRRLIITGAAVIALVFTSPETEAAPYQTRVMGNVHYRIFSEGHYRLPPPELIRFHRSFTQAHRYLFNRYGITEPAANKVAIAMSSSLFREITGLSHEQGGIYLSKKGIYCFFRPEILHSKSKLDAVIYHEVLRHLIYRARRGSEAHGYQWMEEAFCEARYPLFSSEKSEKRRPGFNSCSEFKDFIHLNLPSDDFTKGKGL